MAQPTLVLPYLVAGRDLADRMVDLLGSPLRGQVVVVDSSATSDGSESFASQLVKRLLVDEAAERLVLRGGPGRFAGYVADAAERLHVADRVELPGPVLTP